MAETPTSMKTATAAMEVVEAMAVAEVVEVMEEVMEVMEMKEEEEEEVMESGRMDARCRRSRIASLELLPSRKS